MDSGVTPDTDEDSAELALQVLGVGDLLIQDILSAHPTLSNAFSIYEPIHTAAVFGGLLTVPELQSNCCRLEALAHIAVAFARGKKKPSKSAIGGWFSAMSSGPCGRYEDPAEDAFTSVVTTPRGNFRILEGIWESASFFLQRIVNVIEGTPREGRWNELRGMVYALLTISELVCERAELARYTFGNAFPVKHLPSDIQAALQTYRDRVAFSDAELRAHGVLAKDLTLFMFEPKLRNAILTASLGHSPLLHHPLLRRNDQVIVALPTAISVAIRALVVSWMGHFGLGETLLKAIASEYRQFFWHNPPLGSGRRAPIQFQPTKNGVMASYAGEVDTGRYLQLIFVLDTLEGFANTGLAGANPDPSALSNDFDRCIDECRNAVTRQLHFRQGLTLIIGCGIGRAVAHFLNHSSRSDWRIAFLSAPDVSTLSCIGDVKPQLIWRILDAEQELAGQGVCLFNINGLLNLVAWVRSLDGHVVKHSAVPDGFGSGGPCQLMIDSTWVRDLRMEVAKQVDRHGVQTSDGVWVDVRKTNDSLFEDERSLPLYVCGNYVCEGRLPIVFVTDTRRWWCEVVHPHTFERWKIMSTWLPKIAAAVDREVKDLPTGSISVRVRFGGYRENPPEGQAVSREEIQNRIRVHADLPERLVEIETDEAFERGLANPKNIAEAALVAAIVSGLLTLAGRTSDGDAIALERAIIRDEHARDCHAFHAREFRDFVRESLPDAAVKVDSVDDATLRLGLGWRVRNREDGSAIEGKSACTAFLNKLVRWLEDDLCSELRSFDRQSLVMLAIRNYEGAMIDQRTWRLSAAAILALHDKEAARAVIAEHESENYATLLTSRVLVELAVCECPIQGGMVAGEMDLSRLMARLRLAISYGGWSDAIHLDAMTPSLRVTPLGDIHADQSFFDDIVIPFGRVTHDSTVRSSIEGYARNFEPAAPVGAVEHAFEPEFVSAWKDEHIFLLDDFRRLIDELEDIGIKQKRAVFTMSRSDLHALLGGTLRDGSAIAQALTTIPRQSWRVTPAGLSDKDRQPWRFRRRLSILRRPIIQIDDSSDLILVIAPGLLRDAVAYSVRCYHEGSFPSWQLNSASMRSWAGQTANRRGKIFTENVAARLTESGWKTEREVSVKKILQMSFKVDYGDVDVLAWNDAASRVLLIECKDLHFHKTPGELAEQLSDFRGETRDGKRDLLKRHFDRCEILNAHPDQVASYLHLKSTPVIDSVVVFRNPVPMLFAWKNLVNMVKITTYEQLDQI